MRRVFLTISISLLPLFSHADGAVSVTDQAAIYLSAGENLASGLKSKIIGLQYYACRDVEVLKLTHKALSVEAINQEATKQNPWILRNLDAATESVEKLSDLCKDSLSISEVPEAKKIADKIAEIMSWE